MSLRTENILNSASTRRASDLFKKIQDSGAIQFGTGFMGTPIATNKAAAGIPIIAQDVSLEVASNAAKTSKQRLDGAVKARAMSPYQRIRIERDHLIRGPVSFPDGNRVPDLTGPPEEKKEQALAFLEEHLDPDIRQKYQSSMLVVEALPENLVLKQKVFKFLSYVLPEDAIIGTNTSTLSVDDIAKYVVNPERVIGIHYFMPADQNQLAEIIVGSKTSPDVAAATYFLLKAEGRIPIICQKDSPLAIANRILIGLLNEIGIMAEEGIASRDEIDRAFLEVLYPDQIKIKFQAAQEGFKKTPKLDTFKDEADTYKQVLKLERSIEKAFDDLALREKLADKKVALLQEARGRVNQKFVYAELPENGKVLGSFFINPKSLSLIKGLAREKVRLLDTYLNKVRDVKEYKYKSFKDVTGQELKPYEIPSAENVPKKASKEVRQYIKDRLRGSYIALAKSAYDEGLGSAQDIELTCLEGFKYNIGPFSLAKQLGIEETKRVIDVVNKALADRHPSDQRHLLYAEKTGIIISGEYKPIPEEEISGIQIYTEDGVGHIVLGRDHIQMLKLTNNSLNPAMLKAMYKAVTEYENDDSIKAIMIESLGGKTFCSGFDLEYFNRTKDMSELTQIESLGNKLMDKLANCKKTTIAIVDGTAAGGGVELAAACKLRFATDNASITLPETAIGFFPAWGGTERIPALIGKELALSFICNPKGAGPTGVTMIWMIADEACRAGFFDNPKPMLRSELHRFVADLVENKIEGIDIAAENPSGRKPEYDKVIKDFDIRKKFGLGKLPTPDENGHPKISFVHQRRGFTKKVARQAEALIRNSDNPNYKKEIAKPGDAERLMKRARLVQGLYIQPWIKASQSTVGARSLEIFFGSLIQVGKVLKKLMG